jgi:hypothetical protein
MAARTCTEVPQRAASREAKIGRQSPAQHAAISLLRSLLSLLPGRMAYPESLKRQSRWLPAMSLLFETVASRAPAFASPRLFSPRSPPRRVAEPWRPRSEKRYGFVQAPDGRNKQLGSGSGRGLQGRGPLSAAEKGSPRRLQYWCF